VKIANNIKKNYFYYILTIFLAVGMLLSLKVGITHDESHNNLVWEFNKKKFFNIFFNKNFDVSFLETYHGFYGVGFYYLSSILELFTLNFIDKENLKEEGALLLAKHPTVFLFFVLSGIYLRKLIYLSTRNKNYSNLCCLMFLTYPYLLGHSLFNVKDVPFMSLWMICTYYIYNVLDDFFLKSKIKKKKIVIFGILTAYLLSIRISGILIFLEYLFFLILFLKSYNYSFNRFLKDFYKDLFIFALSFFIFLYIFYPSFWNNPFKFFYSIIFMSEHIQTVCTITLGECMKAQDLPPTYLFIWLFFKLPLVILMGLVLFPLIEKKLFLEKRNLIIVGSLMLTISSIILILILLNVNLYDELRQVLFLIPLIFIISLITIFNFKKKISIFLVSFFIIFFFVQNLKIFPYNYLWLNNLNIFLKVNDNFEKDYWGASTKNIANVLNNNVNNKDACIISNRNDGINYFIKDNNKCFKPFNDLYKKNERPFYIALTERSLRKGSPNNCKLFHEEKIKINLSQENIVLAKILECN